MKKQIQMSENEMLSDLAMSLGRPGRKDIKQILVVDDEPRIREVYQSIFKMLGFKVFTAANAPDACVLLAAEEIDIIILDINLDQHIRPALFRVIRHFCKKSKIIISSVYPINEQMKIFENADGYFDKSDNNEVLVRMVGGFYKNA